MAEPKIHFAPTFALSQVACGIEDAPAVSRHLSDVTCQNCLGTNVVQEIPEDSPDGPDNPPLLTSSSS